MVLVVAREACMDDDGDVRQFPRCCCCCGRPDSPYGFKGLSV